MPEHTDPTPPPDEQLPGDARSRIRADLLDATRAPGSRPARPWLVPGLSAAAVLALVASGVWLGRDDGTSSNGSRQVQPAGRDDQATPGKTRSERSTPTPAPEQDTKNPPEPEPEPLPTDYAPQASTCEDEFRHLGFRGLHGATVTADRDYGPATTYLYETKSTWVVCDDFPAIEGGPPTLLSPHQKSRPYRPNTSTLAISSNHAVGTTSSPFRDQFFAAGRDFDGVRAISYTFPDGHTEEAVVGQNGLWSMTYLPTEGVLADPKTNYLDLDPVRAEVSYTGGATETVLLRWGVSDCAQVNQGC